MGAAARRGGGGSERGGVCPCGQQPGEAVAARRGAETALGEAAATALGGGGPWPSLQVGDGAGMEEVLHLTAAALEEKISWGLDDLDFLALYTFPNFRYQIFGLQ